MKSKWLSVLIDVPTPSSVYVCVCGWTRVCDREATATLIRSTAAHIARCKAKRAL